MDPFAAAALEQRERLFWEGVEVLVRVEVEQCLQCLRAQHDCRENRNVLNRLLEQAESEKNRTKAWPCRRCKRSFDVQWLQYKIKVDEV